MSVAWTSWVFTLGAVTLIAAAFTIQRYIHRRWLRNARRPGQRMDEAGAAPLILPEQQALRAIEAVMASDRRSA